jgi:hypothetical protein
VQGGSVFELTLDDPAIACLDGAAFRMITSKAIPDCFAPSVVDRCE